MTLADLHLVLPELILAGGALLLPNHITWGDAFFLTTASPRPVRFIMEEGFMGKRAIGVFCQLFDTVPISSAKLVAELRQHADTADVGDAVANRNAAQDRKSVV